MAGSSENRPNIRCPRVRKITDRPQANNSPHRWQTLPYTRARSGRPRPRLCRQGDRGYRQPVPEGEADAHQIHPNLVSRHRDGAEPGHDNGKGHEADPQEGLFGQGAGAYVRDRPHRGFVEADFFDFPDADEIVPVEHREDAQRASAHRADDGGDRRAGNAQGREAEMPADEKIIEHDVDQVGHQIGG